MLELLFDFCDFSKLSSFALLLAECTLLLLEVDALEALIGAGSGLVLLLLP